mgnify:CR=1 FL=1
MFTSDASLKSQIERLEAEIAERAKEREALAAKLADIDLRQTASSTALRDAQNELAMRKYTNRKLDINWAELLTGDPWYAGKELKYAMSQLMDGKIGLEWAGQDTETEGYAFKLWIQREELCPAYFLLLRNALLTILPYIKPRKDGSKRIKLMEPSLSEFGVYNIMEKDGMWSLVYGSRYQTRNQTANLDDFLKYLAQNFAMSHDD